MKKHILSILAIMVAMCTNAQEFKDLASLAPSYGYENQRDKYLYTLDDEPAPADNIYATYAEWQNKWVNPYKIPIKNIPDSLTVDCREYYHPTEGDVTSPYGPRWGRFHHGIDLRVSIGEPIHAAFNGKVRVTDYDKYGYGYFVVIRHDNGLETLYGHLSKIQVVPNQTVLAGDVIGLGGNTGRSTGPHLHFEFRYLGNSINPTNIVDFQYHVPYNDTYLVCKAQSFKELQSYSAPKYHIVRSGETLSSIARKYHTTIDKLCKLNNLKKTSVLRVKQRLRYA